MKGLFFHDFLLRILKCMFIVGRSIYGSRVGEKEKGICEIFIVASLKQSSKKYLSNTPKNYCLVPDFQTTPIC